MLRDVAERQPEAAGALAGRVALVTGSTSGIGLGIARAFAKAGASIVLNGFGNAEEIRETVSGLAGEYGVTAHYSPADMTSPSAIAEMIGQTLDTFGRLDILVNNAGIQHVSPIEQFPVEKWDAVLAINLSAAFHTTRLALPAMRQQGWGRILAVGSSGISAPLPNLALSNLGRAALAGYLKTLAAEVAADGVTVNLLLPGRIATDRATALDRGRADRSGRSVDDVEEEAIAQIPAGRYGEPAEFGGVAAFLCSRHASYVTGTAVRCDGGLVDSL